ncbi:dihydropteroate synthase [Thalassotalea loyana]|uniref:Dihydropteroate synthase n=1 Tax=Thalassotalea loyana TaxID=280483 RepID=A0ABQ6HGP5_9GAMM|nr:dihydropteroate synthase [Thalassotalea loyana]BEI32120.1 dihydropteroate synthase [Thalassomonas sp.]GLX85671.1 dihydropteroate synthase [Thalassotalea loyana]
MTVSFLQCPHTILDLSTPHVMGILNVTPDSFSDGGKFFNAEDALKQVQRMIDDGASIIDVGGESTRPGAKDVSLEDELNRVIPVIKAIKEKFDILVSVDTSKAQVMEQSILAGADIINDVRALQNEGCVEVMAKYPKVPICLMHMQGLPRTMQENPQYDDVVGDIIEFFKQRIAVLSNAGIDKQRVMLDPGFGFGKTLTQNYELLGRLSEFMSLELPLFIGISRKSMIGNLLNREVNERLAGSLTAAVISAQQGAKIIRVHDVPETVDALKVLAATQQSS